ncbi:MAG TPA: hypothetical protein VK077_01140 [Virgibacillus sp.]|nr:hypothetical protein [Virgibacillus sp.]
MKKKLIAGALAIGVIFSMSTAISATTSDSPGLACGLSSPLIHLCPTSN